MMYISSSRECLRKISITNVDIIKLLIFITEFIKIKNIKINKKQ